MRLAAPGPAVLGGAEAHRTRLGTGAKGLRPTGIVPRQRSACRCRPDVPRGTPGEDRTHAARDQARSRQWPWRRWPRDAASGKKWARWNPDPTEDAADHRPRRTGCGGTPLSRAMWQQTWFRRDRIARGRHPSGGPRATPAEGRLRKRRNALTSLLVGHPAPYHIDVRDLSSQARTATVAGAGEAANEPIPVRRPMRPLLTGGRAHRPIVVVFH